MSSIFRIGNHAWLVAAMLFLAVPGCERQNTGSNQGTPDLPAVNAAQLEAIVNGQRGRVVLIDFWATWCGPCRELFPHTVALHRQFADQGLSVLTVSVDDVENVPEVRAFLRRHHAQTMNFICREGGPRNEFEPFGLGGSIPCIVIYDRQGRRRELIVGRNEPLIDSTVRKLLAER